MKLFSRALLFFFVFAMHESYVYSMQAKQTMPWNGLDSDEDEPTMKTRVAKNTQELAGISQMLKPVSKSIEAGGRFYNQLYELLDEKKYSSVRHKDDVARMIQLLAPETDARLNALENVQLSTVDNHRVVKDINDRLVFPLFNEKLRLSHNSAIALGDTFKFKKIGDFALSLAGAFEKERLKVEPKSLLVGPLERDFTDLVLTLKKKSDVTTTSPVENSYINIHLSYKELLDAIRKGCVEKHYDNALKIIGPKPIEQRK